MWYIQTSADQGQSFTTVRRTANRTQAFQAFENLAKGERTRMFQDNHLVMTTHLEDAQAEITKINSHRFLVQPKVR